MKNTKNSHKKTQYPSSLFVLIFFSTDVFARGHGVLGGSFTTWAVIACVLLAIYLWRHSPLLSSTIIFTLIAIATQSFLPLLLALCCLGYLFFSARTSVDITTPNSKHYPETIADTENADKTNPQSKKEITLKKKDYRFSELSWIAYSEGIHSKDIAKHYDYEDLSIDDQDVTLLYEGAVYHVPIKNIKNWERWGNPTSQKESNLSEKSIEKVYRWQRIGEFDLIDLSNSKIEFKSVTPVVRFEYEGMLVVNTKGEETFIDAREIQNYWDF